MKFAVLLFNQNLIMLFYLLIGYFLVRRKLVGFTRKFRHCPDPALYRHADGNSQFLSDYFYY